MELHPIPHTPLQVSPLCLGTMTFGTPVAEAEAIALTLAVIERGVNFIDTANMYEGYARYIGSPGGVAEEILGKALGARRAQVVLATKVGMKIGPADDDQGLSRAHILREVERSLVRLQTDYIDLYYMHKPDPATPLAESVQAFDDLVSAGKIRYWGVSNFSAEQLGELLQLCDQNGLRRPVAVQPAYSYLKRDIEKDLLPLCQQEQLAVIPYQVLQGGLLTGKYRRGEPVPANSRQVEKPAWTMPLTDEMFDRLEQCAAEAQSLGRGLMQHALLSLLEQPPVVSLVVGIKNLEQLEALIAAVE
jgi:aryl-alcohol dehydrogenase-like predicted oxidoreductase